MIQDIILRLLNRMNLSGRSGEIMSMNLVYKAMTADIITGYCFGKSTNYVDRKITIVFTLKPSTMLLNMFIGWFMSDG